MSKLLLVIFDPERVEKDLLLLLLLPAAHSEELVCWRRRRRRRSTWKSGSDMRSSWLAETCKAAPAAPLRGTGHFSVLSTTILWEMGRVLTKQRTLRNTERPGICSSVLTGICSSVLTVF